MPTETLFRSIELFFHYPSAESLDDLKAICLENRPMHVLLKLQYKINKTDSLYFNYLELYDFKSEYANMLVEKFEGTVAKLVIAYGICRNFTTNGVKESVKHMEETANSIITLIRKQRKDVPNLLTSEIIHRHLDKITVPGCFNEAVTDWVDHYNYGISCPHKATVSVC